MFKVDLVGRINKYKLSKNEILLPLYEAVVNSFQSIEELGNKKELEIRIKVLRDIRQDVLENKDKGESYPITGFIIEDNGIGFNENNYNSFLTSDSTYKKAKGGKGIGRFSWLKIFDDINIVSIYNENNKNQKVEFSFVLDNDNPIKDKINTETDEDRKTIVKLCNIKSEYCDKIPRELNKIGMKIIEHCLAYFIQEDAPRVIIEDNFDIIDLRKKFNKSLSIDVETESFKISGIKFDIQHIKLFESDGNKNRIHYCANWREVKTEPLNSAIPELKGKIKDGEREFLYSAYVSSSLLDDIVNDERTEFNYKLIDQDLLNQNGVTKNQIESEVVEVVKKYLKNYIEPIKKEKKEFIEGYIKKEKPQYKSLLKYKLKEIENLKCELSGEELELELFKIQQKFHLEVKKQGKEFLKENKIKDITKFEEYKKRYIDYIEKENEVGKSTLAEYIIHRKIVIDLFENAMNYNEQNKYALEEYIHNLIFPMKTVSDDIDYEKHNLWLIDERLSYHYYLASDLQMKNIEVINVDTKDRPDILILDNPVVLSNEDSKPFNALTLIEFKRPMRDDYTDEDNPINQVLRYTSDIRSGAKKDKKGRPISVTDNAPFYLYIIADLTPKLKQQAIFSGLKLTPDGLGYFGYKDSNELNAYIEIISYEKLLEDSKKRNRVLFDKLFK
ncbi:ATP-binding protein [Clostridium sp. Sa3CUN1]|uniref:ATP-binding protein n=1 Tax=Clostridium gallinarum TaxID=2762246 RepID=A0ABR8Q1A6_9CLOT|nr:ATP-binding protein [Clostridium gallinarum]MBD7914200.1 ATP-binding protein [Clostridium gallinarum]